ncbi:unnamed protein product [Spirodela intermedia]|uniref:Nucleoplasmin-like domain-containing protein n=1 Tax=Spirodela intermedia TaxID=51605 RepID=A0A7I8J2T4_SPIIN|nr:unnamed protein product [Spirodela intermedia]CAA6663711.1 unnamed protein product [Spirodela intermedia]
MEFWGVEVKSGETVKYEAGDNKYLHLSQKDNKANESATIYVKFDDKKLVIGTLSADKCPQISYDLVFEKGFELSHNWKYGNGTDSEFEYEDSPVKKESKENEDLFIETEPKDEPAKPKANVTKNESLPSKADVKALELKKAIEEDGSDDDDDDDEDDSEDESDDEDMLDGEGDSDDADEDDSSEEEEEATPKKGDNKKRPAESASKTPIHDKKAKLVAPPSSQKSGGGPDGKKGGHTATPYPTKQGGKTPATSDKSKQQTPKSGGSVACQTFKDESALRSTLSPSTHPNVCMCGNDVQIFNVTKSTTLA